MLQGGREGFFSALQAEMLTVGWIEETEPDKKPARIALWEKGRDHMMFNE